MCPTGYSHTFCRKQCDKPVLECVSSGSHVGQQGSYCWLLRPQLADVYGNVFCIRLGRHKTIFVSGWKMVKEAIVTQADNFVDRPYSPMVTRIYSGNSGE